MCGNKTKNVYGGRVNAVRPFFLSSQNHYLKDVPFHNCTHAADVTQTSHTLLSAQAFEVSVYLVLV